jgi:hypothetical protein
MRTSVLWLVATASTLSFVTGGIVTIQIAVCESDCPGPTAKTAWTAVALAGFVGLMISGGMLSAVGARAAARRLRRRS